MLFKRQKGKQIVAKIIQKNFNQHYLNLRTRFERKRSG